MRSTCGDGLVDAGGGEHCEGAAGGDAARGGDGAGGATLATGAGGIATTSDPGLHVRLRSLTLGSISLTDVEALVAKLGVARTASELKALSDRNLARFVREELYPFSRHYRRVFDGAGVDLDTNGDQICPDSVGDAVAQGGHEHLSGSDRVEKQGW